MRIKLKEILITAIITLLVMIVPVAAAPPVFTGDVLVDFIDPYVIIIPDAGGIGDVGIPAPPVPPPIIPPITPPSGNDMADIRFYYDTGTDTLYVGIDTAVIAGDVDNNGDPGTAGPLLLHYGGTDNPDFGGSETFTLSIDINQDGIYDVVTGTPISGDITLYMTDVYNPVMPPSVPGMAFLTLTPLPNTGILYGSPTPTEPDLEFTILSVSTLPINPGPLDPDPLTFGVLANIGSQADDGIGEDFITNILQLAAIGDYVWYDDNNDGYQDPGEVDIPGVIVNLYDCQDNFIATTTTDGTGWYQFIVNPGDYYVEFILPPNLVFSPQDAAADNVDSDADQSTGKTICFNVPPGVYDDTWDAGMYEPAEIIVCKWTDPWGADQLFDFETNYMDPFQLSDDMCQESGPLEAGIYSVEEVNIPEDWVIYQIYCDGKDPESIDLSPGETVVCNFVNMQLTKIIVHKTTIPAGESQIFNFDSDYAGPFDLLDGGSHDSGWLPPYMLYWVQEVNIPAGWDLTDQRCEYNLFGSSPDNIYPYPGEIVHCYFENTKRGEAQAFKTINGQPPGELDPVFTFTLQGPEVDETDTPDLSTGLVDFNDAKLIPGETYTICESTLPAGWMTNWMLDGVSVTPISPVEGTYCYDFTVEPGQEVTFAIDNSMPPGGEPRTIGYWKNWNRCTNGNQAETAAKNGGPENGFYLVEDLLPIALGCGCLLEVTECGQAVTILNMKDPSKPEKKQKSANDAAYKLAAQLLAAELNLEAGAVVCPELQTHMADAHDLLCSIGFDGTGTFLTSKQGDPDDRAEALYLAGMLDQYNNGDLCPLPV